MAQAALGKAEMLDDPADLAGIEGGVFIHITGTIRDGVRGQEGIRRTQLEHCRDDKSLQAVTAADIKGLLLALDKRCDGYWIRDN